MASVAGTDRGAGSGKGWKDVGALFRSCAESDLLAHGEVDPAIGAFDGEELQFLAWLRPFGKGHHGRPLLELSALAVLLGANRMVVSMGARAWSMDDPVPPVIEDADLRQRVVAMTFVDGSDGGDRLWSELSPFDLRDGEVVWQPTVHLDEGEGMVGELLRRSVVEARAQSQDAGAVRRQLRRVARRGHSVYLSEPLAHRLGEALVR